jgi:hypothetical protein
MKRNENVVHGFYQLTRSLTSTNSQPYKVLLTSHGIMLYSVPVPSTLKNPPYYPVEMDGTRYLMLLAVSSALFC